MSLSLKLPTAAGGLETFTLSGRAPVQPASGVAFNRIAYSAAHVVADPVAAADPWLQCAVDWGAFAVASESPIPSQALRNWLKQPH